MGLALFAGGVSVAQSPPEPIAPQSQQASPAAPAAPGSMPVRVTDQPLAVRVIDQPRTEAQIAAEQRERADRTALSNQLLIFAALLVAVGAFLAIAFAVQVFYLGLGLRAMRSYSQKADRNVMATQRAFVYVSELTWNSEGGNIRIIPVWSNSGTTPTRKLRIGTNWKASHGELRPDDINYVQPPENLFLGPGSKAEFGAIFIPIRDIQAAIEQRVNLYVWGRAAYDDLFEGTRPHFFEFCHRVEVAGETPDKMRLSFTQFGSSNGSDEDHGETADASA
jgi:hypothetical protein